MLRIAQILLFLLVLKIGDCKSCAVFELGNRKARLLFKALEKSIEHFQLFLMLFELLLLRTRKEMDTGELNMRIFLALCDEADDRILVHSELTSVSEPGIDSERQAVFICPI